MTTGTTLQELAQLAGVQALQGDARVRVSGLVSDSRAVGPSDLFAALSGIVADGHAFIGDAVTRGAAAVLAERPAALQVPLLLVDDVRARLGPIAHRVYGDPTAQLRTVGVTGTNGKTTVTYLLESVLRHAGERPALLGTVAMRGPAGQSPSLLTTPEADTVARFAHQQRQAGATHLVMEVSSHGIEQHRVDGVQFEVAAFTNLSQDHLDYHGTMEVYGEVKAQLFVKHRPKFSVLMVDGEFGRALSRRAHGQVVRCSASRAADAEIRALDFRSTRAGITAQVQTPEGEIALESPLFGAHNLENLLVVLGVARCLGLDHEVALAALKQAPGAPGRMERVADPRDVLVLVDYAHTPDALSRALTALRSLTRGRLLVVAGCGGDRDRKKRAPMGEIAAQLADLAVLTSDNPRTEEPRAILRQMEQGAQSVSRNLTEGELASAAKGYVVIEERARAIGGAIAAARAGDTVLIAGKGHETYQIVGDTRSPFDDRVEAAKAIAACTGAP